MFYDDSEDDDDLLSIEEIDASAADESGEVKKQRPQQRRGPRRIRMNEDGDMDRFSVDNSLDIYDDGKGKSRKDKAKADGSKADNTGLTAKKVIIRTLVSIVTALFITVLGLLGVIAVLEFGPSKTARDLFVNSAMESSAGKFLAKLFLSDETIADIRKANSVVAVDEVTDSSLVDTSGAVTGDGIDEDGDGLDFYKLQTDTYTGILVKVYDPSRVCVGISGEYGENCSGKKVCEMVEMYGGVLAVNAGGFYDANGMGTGGIPDGLVISDGELKYGSLNTTYEVIGFDNENKLVVGNMTAQAALDRGVHSAVSFGPILIVNGEAAEINGAGSGLNPRTAVGQCADGTILLLVIDGRQTNSLGASYADLIDVMLQYGAVNAANLDGGSSSVMYYNGEYINNCSSMIGDRSIPTCILVK